jgi:hypothetical protein
MVGPFGLTPDAVKRLEGPGIYFLGAPAKREESLCATSARQTTWGND